MNPYDKLCDHCAEALGGEHYKTIVVYNVADCANCKQEASCLSAKDYRWPMERLVEWGWIEEVRG
jgi:hypothetical protein